MPPSFVWLGLETLKRELLTVAQVDSCDVLLVGETGTGKSTLARFVHVNSPRSRRQFVEFDCGRHKGDLLSSELFGHVRGAFTGAVNDRRGCFENAHDGTLFLDEVGRITLEDQQRFLGVLENRAFNPTGSARIIKVDVRIVSAADSDLEKEVRDGRFHRPLYERLRRFLFTIPPLRERREAIPELIHQVLSDEFGRLGLDAVPDLTTSAMEAMVDYEFPGNVRELENTITQAALFAKDAAAIDVEHLVRANAGIGNRAAGRSKGPAPWMDAAMQGVFFMPIAESLPGFLEKEGRLQVDAYMLATMLVEGLERARGSRPREDASRALFTGLAVRPDWMSFEALAYALAIAVRWDIAVNYPEEDLRIGVLGKVYTRTFNKTDRGGGLYKRVADLVLAPEGE